MKREHEIQRELILSYEELEADERRLADIHLSECPDCRRLMDRLLEAEKNAGDLGELSLDPAAAPGSGEESRQARSSLESLRQRLDAGSRDSPARKETSRGPERPVLRPAWRERLASIRKATSRHRCPRGKSACRPGANPCGSSAGIPAPRRFWSAWRRPSGVPGSRSAGRPLPCPGDRPAAVRAARRLLERITWPYSVVEAEHRP